VCSITTAASTFSSTTPATSVDAVLDVHLRGAFHVKWPAILLFKW